MDNTKTVLITGCSSGFGKITSEYLKNKGYKVFATTRKELDVCWPFEKIKKYIASLGPIDVLINNAGYGELGSIYDMAETRYRNQFETNVFGLLKVTQAVLPTMRKQKRGLIINVSSVAGFFSNPHGGIYSSSKFAVEAITQALRTEESLHGIWVTSINPGPFDTGFWQRAKSDSQTNSLVDKNMSRRESPLVFSKKIESIINNSHPGPRYMVGYQAIAMRLLYRLVPDFLLDILFRAVYANSLR